MNLYSTVPHTQYRGLLISPVLWVCCFTQKHHSYLFSIIYESREREKLISLKWFFIVLSVEQEFMTCFGQKARTLITSSIHIKHTDIARLSSYKILFTRNEILFLSHSQMEH